MFHVSQESQNESTPNKNNTVLHVNQKGKKGKKKIQNTTVSSSTLFQVLPVTLINQHRKIKTYAFLDPGSSVTLLEEDVARQLELTGPNKPLEMTWTQGTSSFQESSCCGSNG